MAQRKTEPDILLVGGPYEGKMADGDALGWFVGATIDVGDGQLYRRDTQTQASYQGENKVTSEESSTE